MELKLRFTPWTRIKCCGFFQLSVAPSSTSPDRRRRYFKNLLPNQLSACGSIFSGEGQSSSRIRKLSGFLCANLTQKSGRFPEMKHLTFCSNCAQIDSAYAAGTTTHCESFSRYIILLAYLLILPKRPGLLSGRNATFANIAKTLHPSGGLRWIAPICYIYAFIEGQIPCFAMPAA